MSRPIYTASSVFAFCQSIVVRILALAGFVWLFGSYHENPVVVVIAMILCLWLFFSLGNEEMLLYEDRLVMRSTSLACAIFSSGVQEWKLSALQQIVVPKDEPPSATDRGLMLVFALLIPRRNQSIRTPFRLEFKNGEVLKLSSELSNKKLSSLSAKANQLLLK